MLELSLIRLIEVFGEAAARVTHEGQAAKLWGHILICEL